MPRRGELYRVPTATHDPRRDRVVLIVSRQRFVQANYSTVMCVPAYSSYDAIGTQVLIGPEAGMKRTSSLHCDEVLSVQKSLLTHYVGSLSDAKMIDVSRALAVALAIEPEHLANE